MRYFLVSVCYEEFSEIHFLNFVMENETFPNYDEIKDASKHHLTKIVGITGITEISQKDAKVWQ